MTITTTSDKTQFFADLHSDLLDYIAYDETRSIIDIDQIGCALPNLQKGGVKIQVLPIFTETQSNSAAQGVKQAEAFQKLANECSNEFSLFSGASSLAEIERNGKIILLPAIENGSSFCLEDEPLDHGLSRLDDLIERTGTLLYVGLTWFGENRFGGGNGSTKGLEADGRVILDWLVEHDIALDLTHASDELIDGALSYSPRSGRELRILSSHSNARAMHDIQRNLSDDAIREVVKRNGLLGVNILPKFLGGDSLDQWAKHVEHMVRLGGDSAVCLGVDFFFAETLSIPGDDEFPQPWFLTECSNASRFPSLREALIRRGELSSNLVDGICYKNVAQYLSRWRT